MRDAKAGNQGFGQIDILHLQIGEGPDLSRKLRFIHPDDFNAEDQTVCELILDKSLAPGEQIVLHMDFIVKLPKVFARTGYGDEDYFLVGQWFPKIGVFEQNAHGDWAWNCHQFHAQSEFYADFGQYRVHINVPKEFVVGATGKLEKRINHKDGTSSHMFWADDVHDFAWTASPKFRTFKESWKGVELIALMQPEHAIQHVRYFDAARKALAYFEKTLGKYPYPVLTMVDPPLHSNGSGGMEYPMFITCGSIWGVGSWFRQAELVTVHELGHQYFQGILASNEFEQAFLDEGFNQYFECRIMDGQYGKGAVLDWPFLKMDDLSSNRLDYVSMDFPQVWAINQPAWKLTSGTYGVLTYSKTATALSTLERLIGRVEMDRVMKAYYRKYQFKHPRFEDFKQTVHTVLEKDYDWFFNQIFDRAYICDYAVDTVANTVSGGYFILKREGQLHLPTDVQVELSDGSVEFFVWDSPAEERKFEYGKCIVQVKLDPQKKNLLDLNLLNNSYRVRPKKAEVWPWLSQVLAFVQQLLLIWA